MSNFRLCAFADEADKSLSGQIKALRENGIDLIELRGIDGKNVAELTPAEAKETARRLGDNGIAVWSIGSPIGKVAISSDRDAETDRFCRVLETAVITRARNIRLFSFYGTDGDRGCLPEVLERLNIMLERARGTGVTLCHENEKGIYGDNAARCFEIYDSLRELKGIFDPANFIQCGQDVPAAWNLLKDYIAYAHIKDAKKDGNVVPAGMGEGRIPELIPEWEKYGVSVLTLEPHLRVFDGLRGLENGERPKVGESGFAFSSGREAFDYAVNALKNIL